MPARKKVAAKKPAAKKSTQSSYGGALIIQSAPTRGNFTRSDVRKAVKVARKIAR